MRMSICLSTGVVFPAYAGVNLGLSVNSYNRAGIPRVCGGEPNNQGGRLRTNAYSPRMRG